MKHFQQFLAVGLSLSLCAACLSGCNKTESSSSANPAAPAAVITTEKFVEQEISPSSENCRGLYPIGDELHYFTQEFIAGSAENPLLPIHWFTMGPDGVWQEKYNPCFEQIVAQLGDCYVDENAGTRFWPRMYLDQDKTLYYKIFAPKTKEEADNLSPSAYYYFSVKDGQLTQLDALPEGPVQLGLYPGTDSMVFCGDTVIWYGIVPAAYSKNGEPDHQALLALDKAGNPLDIPLPELPGQGSGRMEDFYYFLDNDENSFYVLHGTTELARYTLGSTEPEIILDASDGDWYFLDDADPNKQISACDGANGNLYFLKGRWVGEGENAVYHNCLYRYRLTHP